MAGNVAQQSATKIPFAKQGAADSRCKRRGFDPLAIMLDAATDWQTIAVACWPSSGLCDTVCCAPNHLFATDGARRGKLGRVPMEGIGKAKAYRDKISEEKRDDKRRMIQSDHRTLP